MKKRTYSKSISEAVNNFLTEDGWYFYFDEQSGLFRFSLSTSGKIKKLQYIVVIKDSEYIVYVISPIDADSDNPVMMANMAEFLVRANYGLKMGNFEMDYDDGEIRFKVHICCEDITPTKAMVQRSIYYPATMFRNYGSGIVDIIFNGVSGKDAVKKCEEENRSELYRMLSEVLDDDEDTTPGELDKMIERLKARLGTDTATEEQDSDDSTSD